MRPRTDVFVCKYHGAPILYDVWVFLLTKASELYKLNGEIQHPTQMDLFCEGLLEGRIKTNFNRYYIVEIGGVLFTANVDADSGSTEIRFLVHPALLVKGLGDSSQLLSVNKILIPEQQIAEVPHIITEL